MEKRIVKKYDRNELVNKKISSFENRFMSNSKWKRLFLTLFENIDIVKLCEVRDFFNPCFIFITTDLQSIDYGKHVHNECIDKILLDNSLDGGDACYYREIEYLEFLKYWKGGKFGRLMTPKIIYQDTNKIKEIISKIGKFELEETEEYLRVIGYK
ncbi:MAG: hypothetical protein LBJ88_00210 [Campylobacteraceae bacterium]|jgi:hypothetical protein|nr:hypothetical protein [Campylobacteraceae bacterium]